MITLRKGWLVDVTAQSPEDYREFRSLVLRTRAAESSAEGDALRVLNPARVAQCAATFDGLELSRREVACDCGRPGPNPCALCTLKDSDGADRRPWND
jgi:hypothetical protein